MRPGRTQAGMSSYRPPYFSLLAFTLDQSENELTPVRLRYGRWAETTYFRTSMSMCRSHVNRNEPQTGFRNLKFACFRVNYTFIKHAQTLQRYT